MKKKSISLILLFFILANCGFEPIYSSKKPNFNIGEIKITQKNIIGILKNIHLNGIRKMLRLISFLCICYYLKQANFTLVRQEV